MKHVTMKRKFCSFVVLFVALMMVLSATGCKISEESAKKLISALNTDSSASPSATATPEQTYEPTPPAETTDNSAPSPEASDNSATATPSQPQLTVTDSGTYHPDTKDIDPGATFYTYQDMAKGFVDIAISAGGAPASNVILNLTQHEYYTADGMAALIEYQLDQPDNPSGVDPVNTGRTMSLPVVYAKSDNKTESINITEIINAAIAAGASTVRIYFSLADTTTEHSAEWFGVTSDNPPTITAD